MASNRGPGTTLPVRGSVLLAALAAAASLAAQATAREWPSPPAWWLRQAACIRSHEGDWTTNTGTFYGAYQFTLGTWQANGGHGLPSQATPAEQTYRAWLNWSRNGHRWGNGQWPNSSRACGLA